MPPWLVSIQASVWKVLFQGREDYVPGQGLVDANSCVANFYEDGSNSVDWHADNEPVFEGLIHDCCIISLSLGATREFTMRQRRNKRVQRVLELGDGDIMTMEGLFQKHWQHRVPAARPGASVGPRFNLTWRTITAHRE